MKTVILLFSLFCSASAFNLVKTDELAPPGLNHIPNLIHHRGKIYAANYGYLSIFNFRNGDPSLLEAYVPTRYGRGDQFNVLAKEDVLLIFDRWEGVEILSIQPGMENAPEGRFYLSENGYSYENGIFIQDSLFYTAVHKKGVAVYNFASLFGPDGFLRHVSFDSANPANTRIARVIDNADVWDIAQSGDFLYAANGTHGLSILDIKNPLNPVFLKTVLTGAGTLQDVEVKGDKLFLAAGGQGVLVYDISDRANPVKLGEYNTSGNAIHIDVDDERIYIADMDDVEVVDYTSPVNLKLVGRTQVRERAMGIEFANGHIYVGGWGVLEVYRFDPKSGSSIFFDFMRAFEFPRTPIGKTVTGKIGVFNHGDQTLVIDSIRFNNQVFKARNEKLSIPARDYDTVFVDYTPVAGAPAYTEGRGAVYSNDAIQPKSEMVLVGNKPANILMMGDPAPLFAVPMIKGGTMDLSDRRGREHILFAFFAPW